VTATEREHLDKIRNRFTRTAESFADFALSRRADETEKVAAAATASLANPSASIAADLGCGPGTLVRALAPYLARAIGVDFTPAMLVRARREASRAGLANLTFVCADAGALPFADASLDLVSCGYTLHHLLAPAQVLCEMARVVRPRGRVAIVDLVVPEGADADVHNHIERVRDPSHATTFGAAGLRRLLPQVGLRILAAQQHHRQREFDEWMHVAGLAPGSPGYVETLHLMESTAGEAAGYSPRRDPAAGALQFTQHVVFLLAEKE
jgi:ubiquinone/menaquinone biosynthesis C-methylase UbiE